MKIRILLLLLILSADLNAQSVYFDVTVLRRYCNESNSVLYITPHNKAQSDSVLTILHRYFPAIDTLSVAADIGSSLRANPFFSRAAYSGSTKGSDYTSDLNLNMGSVASSVGGLDITTIADGLAKFIVQRTKQELNIAFFTKFKDRLDSLQDLKTVFPNTYNLLQSMGDEIYNYDRYIQNLKGAFVNDLNALPKDLPGIIDNHPEIFQNHPDLEALIRSGFYITNTLHYKVHPGDVLAGYPVDYLDKISDPDFKGAMQTLQLVSASLKDTASNDTADYWVSNTRVRKLVTDQLAFKIYLGLLYQEASNTPGGINFKNSSLANFLKTVASKYDTVYNVYEQYKNYILGFSEKASSLDKLIKTYKKSTNDSVNISLCATYFRSSVDLIEYCTGIGSLPVIQQTKFSNWRKDFQPYFDISYSVADLVTDIDGKNYSTAINDALHIYQVIKDKPAIDSMPATKNEMSLTLDKLAVYGGFISAVATAKTSDDVSAAIQAFALPSGSARVKRESLFNVSINAYAGLFCGYEKLQGVASDQPFTKLSQFNTTGVTAPVGIAFSFGKFSDFVIPNGKGHWSHSVFLSVIDIGAITAYRFQSSNDSVKQIPTVQLKDILSPGIFWSIGIPQSPVSLNIGAQIGPNLRKVESTTNDYANNLYWRYSVSLCVDLPVLNLYTKSAD